MRMSIAAYVHQLDYDGDMYMKYTYLYDMYQRRQWKPTSVLLPGKSHGWRSLVSCSPWGH